MADPELDPTAGSATHISTPQGRTTTSCAPAASPPVRLRPWTATDLPVYREWLRPHHDWHRWDGPYFDRPTEGEADAMVARLEEAVAGRGGIVGAEAGLPPAQLVVADREDDSFCGVVSWYWESRETEWARMGIVLHDPRLRGRGMGASALEQWTTLLFAATTWRRLDLATWSGNSAMCGVAESLGLTREATFRRARVVAGEVYDSVVYGVLREEWAVRPENSVTAPPVGTWSPDAPK